MGGRGAYTQAKASGYTYETVDTYEGVKILRGKPGESKKAYCEYRDNVRSGLSYMPLKR